MSYNVLLHPNAIKFLRKLPKKDVERIKAKLSELVNPHSVKAIKLKNKDVYRIRAGNYRILYTVDDREKVVIVFKIDKRERVYDRM